MKPLLVKYMIFSIVLVLSSIIIYFFLDIVRS